jgi:hypothetical protein
MGQLTDLVKKYSVITVGLILFGLFARRAYQVGIGPAAGEIGASFGAFGSGIGSLGTGIKELGQGIGTGTAKLFDPLFTLRDLIFPPEAGNQPAPTASTQGQTPPQTPPSTSSIDQTGLQVVQSFVKEKGFGTVTSKGIFSNQFTQQDLSFAISKDSLRTGVTGLGAKTLAAQRDLSKRYGIPTFDIKGRVSTFGGIVSKNQLGVRSR